MEDPIFFKDWAELGRVALVAMVAYSGFIIMLRSSGKRTLAKMNVFDFIFVVALGSTLSTTILTSKVTVTKGFVACATLIIFQIILSWLTTKSKRVEKLINGEPTLLMFRGQFLADVLRRERVTEEEVRTAIRAHGLASVDKVEAVVLETDGSFAVIWENLEGSQSALRDIAGQEDVGRKEQPRAKDE